MKNYYAPLTDRQFLTWVFIWLGCASVWLPAEAQTLIINATTSAKPGEAISLQGNFGANARFLLASTGVANATLPVLVQRAGQATVQLPPTLSLNLYRVWVEDAGQRSPEVYVNRARGMHFDSPEVSPGGTLRLFGRNLQFPGATAQVRFQAKAGGASSPGQVVAASSDAYQLRVMVPAGLQVGTYTVYVSNGFGGGTGETVVEQEVSIIKSGSDTFGLGVPWASTLDFGQNIYNVRTAPNLPHAKGDGQTNDQPAIQAAINAASKAGGGVVYLPAGTYKVDYVAGSNAYGVLQMRSRVVLRGDGPQTIINYGYTFVNSPQNWFLFFNEVDYAGLTDLKLVNQDVTGNVKSSLTYGRTSHLFLKNVQWDLGQGEGIVWDGVTQAALRGCLVKQGVSAQAGYGGPLRMNRATDLVISGNEFRYAVDGLNLNYTQRLLFENNQVYRDGKARYPDTVTNHLLILNFAENVALLGNLLKVIDGPAQNKNDGEAIIAEGGGGKLRPEAAGTVLAATSTTLRGSQAWPKLGKRPVVAIIKGPGLGQWRYLQDSTTRTNSLTVTRAWDIVPTPTAQDSSRYSVFSWGSRNWLIQGDTLVDNQRGITLYGNASTDVAIVGNVLRNSGSIDLEPFQQANANATEQFTPLYNIQVVNNLVTADAKALSGVFIGVYTTQFRQAKTLGTSVIGLEVRHNTLVGAGKLAVVDDNFPEGYLNLLHYQPVQNYVDQGIPVVLGSIFQDNTARNCWQALHLNTGSYNTYACGTTLDGSTELLQDETLNGTSHASVGTIICNADLTLRQPENPVSTTTGLAYQYYEGSWSQLPAVSSLTPTKTGTATNFDVSAVAPRNYNYALQYSGYVSVPADGLYTFFTNSDDGSRLSIGSTLVVNNDGLHGLQEKSGSIALRQGTHALTIGFLQGGAAQILQVSYQGPGLAKQPLPASALSRSNAVRYRINAGGAAVATTVGDFAADQYADVGSRGATTHAITNTNNPALYQSEHVGNFSYVFPVPNGQYTVILHFAEIYWTQPGQRVFSVSLEGVPRLTDYDIVRKVGAYAAITEMLPVTVNDGQLNIQFTARVDYAKVAAIEVLAAGNLAARVASATLATQAPETTPGGLAIYPNPSAGLFTATYTALSAQPATFELRDGVGRVMQQQVVQLQAGVNTLSLQAAGASPGVYHLFLIPAREEKQVQKVVLTP